MPAFLKAFFLASVPAMLRAECVPKTAVEMGLTMRADAGCANATPTSCTCRAPTETSFPCPNSSQTLWTSEGQQCISVTPDKDVTWAKHNWSYPSSYGGTCGSTNEPASYDCTRVVDTANSSAGHIVNKPHAFKHGHPGYNPHMNSSSWCTKRWCIVDPCTCNRADMVKSTWLNGFYSYSQCNATDSYTAATCTATNEVSCTGNVGLAACKWVPPTTTSTSAAPSTSASSSGNTTGAASSTLSAGTGPPAIASGALKETYGLALFSVVLYHATMKAVPIF